MKTITQSYHLYTNPDNGDIATVSVEPLPTTYAVINNLYSTCDAKIQAVKDVIGIDVSHLPHKGVSSWLHLNAGKKSFEIAAKVKELKGQKVTVERTRTYCGVIEVTMLSKWKMYGKKATVAPNIKSEALLSIISMNIHGLNPISVWGLKNPVLSITKKQTP